MRVRKNRWKHLVKSPDLMRKLRSQECLLGEITGKYPNWQTSPRSTIYEYKNRKFPILTEVIPEEWANQTGHIYLSLREVRIFAEWRARQIGTLRAEVKRFKKADEHRWMCGRTYEHQIAGLQATKANLIDTLLKRNAEYLELKARYDALLAEKTA